MENEKLLFLIYFVTVSIITCIVTVADKSRAQKGRWRIPEATLFFLAFIGGCPAEYLTMKKIRHKTKHKRFMVGLPLIFVLQVLSILFLFLQKVK